MAARKWYLSKVVPKIYGERLQSETRLVDKDGEDRSLMTWEQFEAMHARRKPE